VKSLFKDQKLGLKLNQLCIVLSGYTLASSCHT